MTNCPEDINYMLRELEHCFTLKEHELNFLQAIDDYFYKAASLPDGMFQTLVNIYLRNS